MHLGNNLWMIRLLKRMKCHEEHFREYFRGIVVKKPYQ